MNFCGVSINRSNSALDMSGGEIVLQNSGRYGMAGTFEDVPDLTGTTVRFGNELTTGPGNFEVGGFAPNVVLDTSSGSPQTLAPEDSSPVHIMNLTIQAGGIVQAANLSIHGTSIVNNGHLEIP